jgi:iron complex transport system substrate-binding protein
VPRLATLFALLFSLSCGRSDPPSATAGGTRSDTSATPARPRVVTLTPSSTEVVAALGASDLLVGVDQYSSYPPSVIELPRVGDFIRPNVEAVITLRSDIVVGDETQADALRQLEQAGITTVSSRAQTIEDIRQALVDVGRALDRQEEARRALAILDDKLASAEAHAHDAAKAAGRKPRVLVVLDRRPGGFGGMVAAGPDTYLDDMLRRAAAENAFADSPVRYAQISPEQVIARAPDVILDTTHGDDVEKLRRDWDALPTVPAVEHGRVHILADAMYHAPTPRLGGALETIVGLLWGAPARGP